MTRRQLLAWIGAVVGSKILPSAAGESGDVAPQPYFASVNRAIAALANLGAPIAAADAALLSTLSRRNDAAAVKMSDDVLKRYTLARLSIDSLGGLQVSQGEARPALVEQGWRMFLVRVENFSGRTDGINFSTGWYYNSAPAQMMPGMGMMTLSQRGFLLDTVNNAALIEKMWLMSHMFEASETTVYGMEVSLTPLSSVPVEYHVIQLFSRDHGPRSAALSLTVFPKSGGAGDSASKVFYFDCRPSRVVALGVLDADGRSCVASLTIKDMLDHVYPPLAMRLAPDMPFHEQIYRADGETMRLPDGEYSIDSKRGPEYLPNRQSVIIGDRHARIDVRLERWIDPAHWGWYSGDTHVHAGGCLHYQVPTEGVTPQTMIRIARGEGLAIADMLSWGPSWYYQKQFFSGHAVSPAAALEHPELQSANNATLTPHATAEDSESQIRYDVEISGFPSSHAGHLVLLRLKGQDFPGTQRIEDWPSWNLPILQWAKAQGAVVGYGHCGLGMAVDSKALPNYEIPPMNGVGTQEAIIDVTHGLVDFLSGCDTTPVAELNAWYHLLNCGYRVVFVGETDYPCLNGERVGVGRSYVRLDRRPESDAGYEDWIRNLKRGRLYSGDGRSHFLEFTVNGRSSAGGDVNLATPAEVSIEATVAARLEPVITPVTEVLRAVQSGDWVWGWHIEKARLGTTRQVAVELIVNGEAVDKAVIVADGLPRPLRFKTAIDRSSWVALRIMASGHTSPMFVTVGEKPIRASKRSAAWCRACVDKVWDVKSPFMRASELAAAAEAFTHARKAYETILDECEVA